MHVRGSDLDLFYEVVGHGPDLVVLHPFPAHHGIWLPAARLLSSRYRVILPDLRGHGASGVGEGPAIMEKHADDIIRICDHAGVKRAVFAGESIGGYILFELWRRSRERIQALVFCNTRAGADSEEARAARLLSADDVFQQGIETFVDSMIPRLIGASTRTNRPDLVEEARRMMLAITPAGVAAVQRGMAARPDSTPTLATIDVPVLLIGGDEDVATPPAELELMQRHLPRGSTLNVIPKAGHFAVFERHEEAARLLLPFLAAHAQRE